MVEYLVIAAVLVVALFVYKLPVVNETGAKYLADSVRAFYRSLTYFISLP